MTTISQRHRWRRALYWNAAVWGIGGAWTSIFTILFMTFARAMHSGVFISLLFLAPFVARLLCWKVPDVVARARSKKWFYFGAIWLQALSYALLACCILPGFLSRQSAYWAVIIFWSLGAFFASAASIAYLSWMGSIFPCRKTFSRMWGVQERYKTYGESAALVLSSGATIWAMCRNDWKLEPRDEILLASLIIVSGIVVLAFSVFFLWRMPDSRVLAAQTSKVEDDAVVMTPRRGVGIGNLLRPLGTPGVVTLLLYCALFSAVTQMEQAPRSILTHVLLGGSCGLYLFNSISKILMSFAQGALGPFVGGYADRFGTLPVMIAAQAITAFGALFYAIACASGAWFWMIFAQWMWIAYIGLNVSLPKYQLELSGREDAMALLSLYSVVSALASIFGCVFGALLLQWGGKLSENFLFYTVLFCVAFVVRLLCALVLSFGQDTGGTQRRKIPKRKDVCAYSDSA
ncbi:MAG: hypothetical protein Q4D38_12435 [Planctomycetia bacterium]|nr:hypothetical protein [Planctomycetia bacterium]